MLQKRLLQAEGIFIDRKGLRSTSLGYLGRDRHGPGWRPTGSIWTRWH